METYIIASRSGIHIKLPGGSTIKIIDTEGQQVVDFFAISESKPNESLSMAATIDCNQTLHISKNNYLYTNLYTRMFLITEDTVGKHDLMHPCCRPEMYDYFYHNGTGHPNCYENINNQIAALGLPTQDEIRPFNIFMNTKIRRNGKLAILAPKSRPNDYIELKALISVNAFLAACSVSESACNGGRCTSAKIIVS